MENEMFFKKSENKFLVTLDNKEYIIYESYIINGYGYTFKIYYDRECTKDAKWYRINMNINLFDHFFINKNDILIFGDYFNYILKRKGNELDYDILKYNKTELRCNYKEQNVTFNNKIIAQYYFNEDIFFKEQSELLTVLDRKEKIEKIRNRMHEIR